jgi:hypothetical protein
LATFSKNWAKFYFIFWSHWLGDDVKKFYNIDPMSTKTLGVVGHSLTEAAMEAADTFDVKEMEGKIGERT